MSDRIRFTRASGLPNDTLSFEVDVDGKHLLDLVSLDDKTWEIWFDCGQNEYPFKITWQEFIEISYEMHKFIAIENEVVIDTLQKGEVDEDEV